MFLTLKQLKEMEENKIFSQGKESFYNQQTDTFEERERIAIRWIIRDRAIYFGRPWTNIKDHGTKLRDWTLINKLVPCDIEAFKMYRY